MEKVGISLISQVIPEIRLKAEKLLCHRFLKAIKGGRSELDYGIVWPEPVVPSDVCVPCTP